MTVWPSGLRRWLKAPFRKGVGSNPTAVKIQDGCQSDCWWVAHWAILTHSRNRNLNLNLELSSISPPHMGDVAQGNAKASPCCCRHQSWCWPRLATCHTAEATELWQHCAANVVHHTTQVKAWDGLPKVLPQQVLEPNLLEPGFEPPLMLTPASARAKC